MPERTNPVELLAQIEASGVGELLSIAIRKRFGSGFRLDLECKLPPGITILFGPSGAGKTTVLDSIAGLINPDAGCISVAGRILFDSEDGVNVPVQHRGVAYVFQRLALFPHLSVAANVEYGLAKVSGEERRERCRAILDSFSIGHLHDRKPDQISGGERQRVALARALVTDPCVLLLDEPLSAVDALTRSRLLADLRLWNDAHRVPILYATHSREEVFAVGERVVVIEQGKVVAQGSPYHVLEAPRHESTAQLAGFENIFDAVVAALHEREGTMTCTLVPDPSTTMAPALEVPLGRTEPGMSVRIAVRAGDILVATAPPQGLSARNVLAGQVTAIARRDVTSVLQVSCGATRFEVHITPAAETALKLAVGREVWLVIKTYSFHLVQRAGQ
ncbi:MAG: molybdenum ABC transporter ATP-binding protein [Terriglobales bacterium]